MRADTVLSLAALLALPSVVVAAPPAKRPAKPAAKSGPDLPSRTPAGAAFAVVNGERIPLSAYVDRLSLRFGPDIREQLVNEVLLRQEAKRRKLTVSAAEIDATVQKQFGETVQRLGGEEKLRDDLARTRGWSVSDYRAVLRSQADLVVLQEKLTAELVKPGDVTDADVEKRYSDQKNRFEQPEMVQISHILVKRAAENDPVAQRKATELLERVRAGRGTNFAELARESSEDKASGAQGGKVPTQIVRGAHPFGPEFEAAVFNAPVGLVPQLVSTPFGYHIVRVDQKKEAETLPLERVRGQIRTALLEERRREKIEELFVRLRATANVQTGKF